MTTQNSSYKRISQYRNGYYSRVVWKLRTAWTWDTEKIGDEKIKISLALKASNSFNDEDDELNEIDIKDKEDEVALLSKKLQRILRDKRNKEKRKPLPPKKNTNRDDQGGSSNTFSALNT